MKHKPQKFYVQRLRVRVLRVPFDMMRYDRCVPATERDSGLLSRIAGHDPTLKPEDRIVEFRRYSGVNGPPNFDRWDSFACEILEWETVSP